MENVINERVHQRLTCGTGTRRCTPTRRVTGASPRTCARCAAGATCSCPPWQSTASATRRNAASSAACATSASSHPWPSSATIGCTRASGPSAASPAASASPLGGTPPMPYALHCAVVPKRCLRLVSKRCPFNFHPTTLNRCHVVIGSDPL